LVLLSQVSCALAALRVSVGGSAGLRKSCVAERDYGINTGFEDATNLGWKLAAVLQGWGGGALLSSYEAERRPVFQSTATDFIEKSIEVDRAFLGRFDLAVDRDAFERHWADRGSGAKGEVNAFEPHYEGSPIVFGPPEGRWSAKGGHQFAARAGHHLAPLPLSDGRSVFDALGENFSLLCLGDEAAGAAAFQAAAQAAGIPLTLVSDTNDGGCKAYQAPLVLIRPDQFVAWCGKTPEDPALVLGYATGH